MRNFCLHMSLFWRSMCLDMQNRDWKCRSRLHETDCISCAIYHRDLVPYSFNSFWTTLHKYENYDIGQRSNFMWWAVSHMWHSQSKGPTWLILISEIQAKTWNSLQKSKKCLYIPLEKRGPLADPIGPDMCKHQELFALGKMWENDDSHKRSHLDASVTEVE